MKKCINVIIAFLCALNCQANAAVYFVAHPDDAELFMAGNLYNDIRGGYPTVIVVLTAGDAGNLTSPNIRGTAGNFDHNQSNNPYYRVRLDAHEIAMFYGRTGTTVRSTENFGASAPAVEKVKRGNVTLYYLNLRDGQLMSNYSAEKTQGITSFVDIFGLNSYTQPSLRETLRQIISRNFKGNPTAVINFPEYDPNFWKPGYNDQMVLNDQGQSVHLVTAHQDHTDHTAVGGFIHDALLERPAFSCVYTAVYMGYAINALPDALSSSQKQYQTNRYTALNNILVGQGNIIYSYDPNYPNGLLGAMDQFHKSFFGKQMWRADEGGGTCTF